MLWASVALAAERASVNLSITVTSSIQHTVSLTWFENNSASDWTSATRYAAGQVICPLNGNAGTYEFFAQSGGGNMISGTTEPTWPQSYTAGQSPPITKSDGGIADWSMVIQGNSASTCSSSSVVMFYIYRSTVSGGSYSNIASSSTTAYVDGTVTSGVTYYYVVTAVDASSNESGYSNQASAVVPYP
jgi:hypothetical protein